MHTQHLTEILVILLAAIAMVPLFQRLKVSPVLGYLAAGVVIGPHVVGAIADPKDAEMLGEFGVVFLLFAIGLELPIERLKAMRRYIFGLGAAQVAATAVLLAGVALALGQTAAAAVIIGGGLALSSTATVLQLLVERGEAAARFGRMTVAVLLFQDLAVVPLLALIPILGGSGAEAANGGVLEALGMAAGKAALLLVGILLVGRFVVRPLYDMIAATHNSELFTATSLFLLLGTAWASAHAGMSMALGAFLAGILLAGTAYRHQIEADIHPFRGLLLGLFFMTVGMSIDLPGLAANWLALLAVTVGLLLSKALVATVLVLVFHAPLATALRVGLLLAQGGEFAFVLFGSAMREGIIASETAQLLNGAVVLSICATPMLAGLGGRWADYLRSRLGREVPRLSDEADGLGNHVVVCGYGRVGKTVCTLLEAEQIPHVALDMDVQRVVRARAQGKPVYYGDAARLDVLKAAGIERAALSVVTLDNAAAAEKAVHALRAAMPNLPLIARARDLPHAVKLEEAGATQAMPEAIESSLSLSERVISIASGHPERAQAAIAAYRADDYALLHEKLCALDTPAPPPPTRWSKEAKAAKREAAGAE